MNSKADFDIQEYVQIESGTEERLKQQAGNIPYPDASDFNDGRVVPMPEAGGPSNQYLSESYGPFDMTFDHSTDTHHSGDMNASIPSITVQGDETNQAHEIYSPMYVNPESPYDAHSPFDHASPLGVPFPNVISPVGSPGYAGSDWGEEPPAQPPQLPFNSANHTTPNPLNWRTRGETFGEFKTNHQQSTWDEEAHSFDQLIEDILVPHATTSIGAQPPQMYAYDSDVAQPNSQQMDHHQAQHRQQPMHTQPQAQGQQHLGLDASQSASQSLQVPGSQGYYYGSSGSEYYLSAPNSPIASPTLSPSSPRSGRSSPLPRRPRAYSSPYEVSTDNDASSPGDTGFVTGSRRRVKKNPSLYPCDQCDKKFTRAYNLRSHMRTHTHERPFACSVCGKAFARQHDRKRHEDLHTGEKRFVCSGTLFSKAQWGCGRRFARADALGRHFRTEAGKACIGPLREDIVSKIGLTTEVSEGIIFQGYVDGEPRLIAEADDENQTRRAVIISALTEQITADY